MCLLLLSGCIPHLAILIVLTLIHEMINQLGIWQRWQCSNPLGNGRLSCRGWRTMPPPLQLADKEHCNLYPLRAWTFAWHSTGGIAACRTMDATQSAEVLSLLSLCGSVDSEYLDYGSTVLPMNIHGRLTPLRSISSRSSGFRPNIEYTAPDSRSQDKR